MSNAFFVKLSAFVLFFSSCYDIECWLASEDENSPFSRTFSQNEWTLFCGVLLCLGNGGFSIATLVYRRVTVVARITSPCSKQNGEAPPPPPPPDDEGGPTIEITSIELNPMEECAFEVGHDRYFLT